MRRARRLLAGLLAAGALLTTTSGCAQSVDPIERLGRKAAQRVNHPSPTCGGGPARAAVRNGPARPYVAPVLSGLLSGPCPGGDATTVRIGTPLDRVLIPVIVSVLALTTGECQQYCATGRSGTRDDGSTWSPPKTVTP